MEPKIYLLDAITPDTKNWTAKVSVVNKTEPRTSSQPSSIRFQKLLLAYNKGAAAIIIDGHAPRTVTAKGKQNTLHEYAALDEQDISLSSTSASVVLINSNIERMLYIKKKSMYFNSKAMSSRKRKPISAVIPNIHIYSNTLDDRRDGERTLSKLARLYFISKSDLLVRGKLAQTNQNFIYPCCAKCHRLTTAAYGHLFECHSCHEIKNAIPRFRFSLLVYDDSGKIEVTVFGDEGEKIMQMDKSLIFDSINSILHQMQLKMKIQYKLFYRQDGTTTLSHTIQILECLDDILLSSSADPAHVPEIYASPKPETTSVPSTTKEHPRSDTHPSSSSRGRASKAKKVE
ncbi:hypothetical protein OROMI_001037 [Orobanche minor]